MWTCFFLCSIEIESFCGIYFWFTMICPLASEYDGNPIFVCCCFCRIVGAITKLTRSEYNVSRGGGGDETWDYWVSYMCSMQQCGPLPQLIQVFFWRVIEKVYVFSINGGHQGVHCCQRTYNIYRINICANFHRLAYYQTSWFYHLHVKTIGPDFGVSDLYVNHINATGFYLNWKNH